MNGWFGVLLLGIFIAFLGVHNVDNAWNMMEITRITGVELVDWTANLNHYTPQRIYMNGVMMTLLGFLIAVIGAAFLGNSPNKKESPVVGG